MTQVTDSTFYWAVLARSRGEVLAAEAESGGLHLGMFGTPGGLTHQETQAWLGEVIGVARESAASGSPGPIPSVLHHAMTGLLFTHAELWERGGAQRACSYIFAQAGDQVGFGWIGDAEVSIWVDGEPCDPVWVTIRDESGAEGRAWCIGADHTVQVRMVWNAPADDATSGGEAEAVWTAASMSHAPAMFSPGPAFFAPAEVIELAPEPMAELAIETPLAADVMTADEETEPADVETMVAPALETDAVQAAVDEGGATWAPEVAEQDAEIPTVSPAPAREGLGTWVRKGLAWLSGKAKQPPPAMDEIHEPDLADSIEGSEGTEPAVETAAFAEDPAEAGADAAATATVESPGQESTVAPGVPAMPADQATPEAVVMPDLIPPTPEAPAITRQAVAVSPPAGVAEAAPVALPPPADDRALRGNKKKSRGEGPPEPVRAAPPVAPVVPSAQASAPPSPPPPAAIAPAAVTAPPIQPAPPIHAVPIQPAAPIQSTAPPSPPPAAAVAPPIQPAPAKLASPQAVAPTQAAAPPIPAPAAPPPPYPAPAPVTVMRSDPAIEDTYDDPAIADAPVAAAVVPPPAPAQLPVAPPPAPEPAAMRREEAVESFEFDPAIADVIPPVPQDPAIADAPDAPIAPAAVATVPAPAVEAAASLPAPAQERQGRREPAHGVRPRRPTWPSRQELQKPSHPAWRKPWVLVTAVMVLFAGGWLVSAGHETGKSRATDGSGMFGGALQAIGLGGPRFTVTANSRPPGAWISVDGKPLTLRTPAVLSLSPGEHTVRFSFADLGGSDFTVRGLKGDRMPLDATLWGALEIFSPNEVGVISVTVDGEPRGQAPVRVDSLSPGVHEVRFSAPGTAAWGQTVDIHVGESRELLARANPSPARGLLQVQATITDEQGTSPLKGGQVYIDGDLRGAVPLTLELPRGPHSVRLIYKDVQAPIQVIDLPGGNQRFAVFELGLDREWPRLVVDSPRIARDRPAVISVSLSGILPGEISGMWLHTQSGTGAWRRNDMTLIKAPGGVVGVAVFPMGAFDGHGVARYYASAGFVAGDEAYTEIRTLQLDKTATADR